MLKKSIFIFIMLFNFNSSWLSSTPLESTQQLLQALKTKLVTLLNTVNSLQSPGLEKKLADQLNKKSNTKDFDKSEQEQIFDDIKTIFEKNQFDSIKDLFPKILPHLNTLSSEANLFEFLVDDNFHKILIDNEYEEIVQKKLKKFSSLISETDLEKKLKELIRPAFLTKNVGGGVTSTIDTVSPLTPEEKKLTKSIKTLTEKAKNHLDTNNSLQDFIKSFKNQWLKRQDLIDWINIKGNKTKLINIVNNEINDDIKIKWNQWLELNTSLHVYLPELLTEEMKIRKENATKNENVLKTYNNLKDDIEFFINKGDQGNFINGITKEIISNDNNLKQFIKTIHDENEKKYKTEKEKWKNNHGVESFHIFKQEEPIKKLTQLINKYKEPGISEIHPIKRIIDFFKKLSKDEVKFFLSKQINLKIELINNIEKFCDLIDQLKDKTNGSIDFKNLKKELLKEKFPLEYLKEYPTDTTVIGNLNFIHFEKYIDTINNLDDLIKLTKLSNISGEGENALKKQIKKNIDNNLENKIKTDSQENAQWFSSALKAQPDTIKNFIQKNPLLIEPFKKFIENIKEKYPSVDNIDQVTTTLKEQEKTKNKIITEQLPQMMNSLSLNNPKEFFIESPLTYDSKISDVIEKYLHEKDNFTKFLNEQPLLSLLHIYYLHVYKKRFQKIDIQVLTNKIEEKYKEAFNEYKKIYDQGFGQKKIKNFDSNIKNKIILDNFKLFLTMLNDKQLSKYSSSIGSAVLTDDQLRPQLTNLISNEIKRRNHTKLQKNDKKTLKDIFEPGKFKFQFEKYEEFLDDKNKVNFLKVLNRCPLEEWIYWIEQVRLDENNNRTLRNEFLLDLINKIEENDLTNSVKRLFFDLIKVPLRGELILADILIQPKEQSTTNNSDDDNSGWDD